MQRPAPMTFYSRPQSTPAISDHDVAHWHTHSEYASQPALWQLWGPELARIIAPLHTWLAARAHTHIYFCGAGTSAFIGETLARSLDRGVRTRRFTALPSTDLVSQPRDFLLPCDERTLFVSFGRSGNSPESIGTLDALDQLAPQADRLHISCNADGALAKRTAPGPGQLRSVVLPPQTHDKGFAMTSSYSTMLLTAIALFCEAGSQDIGTLMHQVAQGSERINRALPYATRSLREAMPVRAVFIGSGLLLGVARESALKILELTAGRIATMWETALGFRHGPKSFVDNQTQLFLLLSADPLTLQYELDLRSELQSQFGVQRVFSVGPASAGCDLVIPAFEDPVWAAVLYVLLAQYLAIYWSQALGLNVDNPFSNGHLTRVVQGVRLYPVAGD